MKYSNNLFVLMGIDGSGKTFQTKRICDYLNSRKISSIRIKLSDIKIESKVNEEKCKKILQRSGIDITEELLTLLIEALIMRKKIEEYVFPELDKGNIVIMDRYVESIFGKASFILNGNAIVNEIFKDIYIPKKAYLLDLNPKIAIDRIQKRDNILENEQLLSKIQNYYLKNFKVHSFKLINAEKTKDEIFNILKADIERFMEEKEK